MTATAIKEEVKKLPRTEQLSLIQFIVNLLQEDGGEDWWDTISEQEKAAIQRGLQQLENGERIPNAVVREEIDRMLGKQ